MQNKIKYTKEDKEPKIEVGQFYLENDSQQLYIVAELQPPGHYALISLTDGISWTYVCGELYEIFDGHEDRFTLVTYPFTVTPEG
jgi:hypothetical protein